MSIGTARIQDIRALVKLINSAYRGEISKKGWTTEADLLKGELRTDDESLAKLMAAADAVFLKYISGNGDITGCVFLHRHDRGLYVGMLSVSPNLQGAGIGKKLLRASEVYAMENNCPVVFMQVISLRHELIAWYKRNGYFPTGEIKPFPNDIRYGIPTQPLEFIVLEKKLTNTQVKKEQG